MSAIYGLSQQPFHTDCASWPRPPRMLSLHCIEGGFEEVSTDILVFDWGAVERATAVNLKEVVWPFQCQSKRAVYGTILQRLPEIGWRVRFDPTLLRVACNGLEKELCSLGRTDSIVLQSGHWLIIDNYRTLHRRSRVGESKSRRVRRCYWG
ncbi:hypothetical protein GRI91_14565 [Altererythrobacter endophyticus]|uniref:Uncharacterized protein n=1 Tax=Altericroceibacterium endophyticum TaxID=1808508 RepID=A0A6I4T7Q0_9SPHN|nr:hypothetical protein [Altericroceibacterium endophyticum]